MFIDSHAHIFDILGEIDLQNIDAVIVPSYNKDNFSTCLSVRSNTKFFPALGIHPEFASQYDKDIEKQIISNRDKIVAIGEIGLDSRFDNGKAQLEAFSKQINLANTLNLPAIIHLVGKESFDIFSGINKAQKGVLHAFSGDIHDAERAIKLGYHISFAGNLTYKRNVHLRKIAKLIPEDRILIETDSPSMLPSKLPRGQQNTVGNITYIAECLAECRNVSVEKIAQITKQNAINLFNLKV